MAIVLSSIFTLVCILTEWLVQLNNVPSGQHVKCCG